MKGKEIAKDIATTVAVPLVEKAVENAPSILERITKKKKEKSFFEENKSWIIIIILSIFVTNLNYIYMLENIFLNSLINMIYGMIVFVLLWIFYFEENTLKDNNKFIKALTVSLIILGLISSFYHIGYAINSLLTFII